jgi:hypothetical protein
MRTWWHESTQHDASTTTDSDLVDIVTGVHGYEVAQRFIDTLSRGIRVPFGLHDTFAGICLKSSGARPWLDLLVAVVSPVKFVVAGATILTPSQWLKRLCTRVDASGAMHSHSLFWLGANLKGQPERTRAAFEFGLRYDPEHPDIAKVVAAGEEHGAILMELLMERNITPSAAPAPRGRAIRDTFEAAPLPPFSYAGSDSLRSRPAAPLARVQLVLRRTRG